MKLGLAIFVFDMNGVTHRIAFDDPNDRICVSLANGTRHLFDNPLRKWGGREYKPCVTHAAEVLRRALKMPLPGAGARKRANATKPARPKVHRPK